MSTRRQFVISIVPVAAAAVFGAGRFASAQAARIEESDPVAVALGYRHNAAEVDAKKYSNFAPGQACSNCQLYTSRAGESWGPCTAVGGRLVNAKGWCVAWVKKA